ncbi:MAG: HD domain-containing protein [Candidatus Ryanbacteria bacterium]|nr:HD domain-containing protein [Candidatus Ryanbacteria bacterium]
MTIPIPKEIVSIVETLEASGFEAFAVGGCVRDILMDRKPKDWDIATSATPEDITRIFSDSVYENAFGTVSVFPKNVADESLKMVEVTPYRTETSYTDKRHPDKVEFGKTLEEDLARRDFTINSLALNVKTDEIIDLFQGKRDFKDGLIRAVGNAEDRFEEDALRIMRALRFAAELGYMIEEKTLLAVKRKAKLLRFIAKERIRDEFSRILLSPTPHDALNLMRDVGVLKFVMPEIEEGHGVGQNKHHIYTVWEHNLFALKYAAQQNWPLDIRMSALLHDVGKPRAKRGDGPDSTFYGHEIIGAKMTHTALLRLRYGKDFVNKVTKLVRYHLFYYNVDEVGDASVRRLIRKVGPEDMEALIQVRICDRIGSGVPKAEPYKLRHFRFLIDKLSRDPISVRMLKVSGDDIMKIAKIEPGPKVGQLLNILLEEVLDDPKKNTKSHLQNRTGQLALMSERELKALADEARHKSSALEEEEVGKIKQRHKVK